jgi:hypothetical protein
MQIAGTPPIDWSGHAARHAERRSQSEAGAGAVRDRTGSPSAAEASAAEDASVAQEAAAKPKKATAQEQIDKFDHRIEHLLARVTKRFGAATAEELQKQIASLQALYIGDTAATEAAVQGAAAPQRSFRAALADLVHEFKHGVADVEPVEGDEPAGDVDPVAGDVDPVAGDTGAVDDPGTDETVVVDPPDVTLPVVPPETTDPIELLDVMLTGVPADE